MPIFLQNKAPRHEIGVWGRFYTSKHTKKFFTFSQLFLECFSAPPKSLNLNLNFYKICIKKQEKLEKLYFFRKNSKIDEKV